MQCELKTMNGINAIDRMPALRKAKSRRGRAIKVAILAAIPALGLMSSLCGSADASVSVSTPTNSSTITVDPTIGLTGWTVGGVSQLATQQFFYRIGPSGGQTTLGSNAAPAPTVNSGLGTIAVNYNNPTFTTGVLYPLSGSGSTASLNEQVTINNVSGASIDLYFFKYADYNLNGQSANQTATISGTPANTVDQYDQNTIVKNETVGGGGGTSPDFIEATTSSALLTSLQSAVTPAALTTNAGAGPGDVNWAMEWHRTIASGGSLILTIPTTIQPVPEPTIATMSLGACGLLTLRRRRRRAN